nr:hypothetical protein [Pseudomonadota bacterium]
MCSILGIFGLQPGDNLPALRRHALELSQRQRHRGPDWSGVHVDDGAILVHERLAIVDPAGGSQPLLSEDGVLALAVNGEIYNHRELKAELALPYAFQTASDCEVINVLYRESTSHLDVSSPHIETSSPRRRGPSALAFDGSRTLGARLRGDDDQEQPGDVGNGLDQDNITSFLNRLNGIFAFALWDKSKGRAIIARDPIGVCPLYWGHDREGRLRVASEMKPLADTCADVAQFPPGHWYDTASETLHKYYER